MSEEDKKTCSDCEKELPLESFSKNKSTKDGLEHTCKECKADRQQKYRDRISRENDSKKMKARKVGRPKKNEQSPQQSDAMKGALTTASPEAIIAALRKGVALEICHLIEEKFR